LVPALGTRGLKEDRSDIFIIDSTKTKVYKKYNYQF
ncbi:hypothetical protein FOPG_19961, partial [Fusarium oxysporum f. sp. conglutinans race 2 54008]